MEENEFLENSYINPLKKVGYVKANKINLVDGTYSIVGSAYSFKINDIIGYTGYTIVTNHGVRGMYDEKITIKDGMFNIPHGGSYEIMYRLKNEKPEFTIDLKYFKEYVDTYKESDTCNNNDIFIKDMLYGIGLAVNKNKYQHQTGYKQFIEDIKEIL